MTDEEAHRILWPDQLPEDAPSGDVNHNHNHNNDRASNHVNTVLARNDYDGDAWMRLVASSARTGYTTATAASSGDEAKFVMGNAWLVENKTLVVTGDKTLREQLDRRIGIGSTSR